MRSNDGPPESVGDLLNRYSVGMIAKSNLRTLGVRLSEVNHIRLEMIAAHYGVPKGTFARDLLDAALTEAMSSLHFDSPDEEAEFDARLDERMTELHSEEVYIHKKEERSGRGATG